MATGLFIQYYGKEYFLDMLIAKLIFYDAKNLSDSEIERCFSGCVLANKLTIACKELRKEIDWRKVVAGQRQYELDFDHISTRQLELWTNS